MIKRGMLRKYIQKKMERRKFEKATGIPLPQERNKWERIAYNAAKRQEKRRETEIARLKKANAKLEAIAKRETVKSDFLKKKMEIEKNIRDARKFNFQQSKTGKALRGINKAVDAIDKYANQMNREKRRKGYFFDL